MTALPYLDDAVLRSAVAGASVLVFPSNYEGFGVRLVAAHRGQPDPAHGHRLRRFAGATTVRRLGLDRLTASPVPLADLQAGTVLGGGGRRGRGPSRRRTPGQVIGVAGAQALGS